MIWKILGTISHNINKDKDGLSPIPLPRESAAYITLPCSNIQSIFYFPDYTDTQSYLYIYHSLIIFYFLFTALWPIRNII